MDLSQSCHLPRLLILILGAFHLLSADVATDDIKVCKATLVIL